MPGRDSTARATIGIAESTRGAWQKNPGITAEIFDLPVDALGKDAEPVGPGFFCCPKRAGECRDELVAKADRALHAAGDHGRKRVEAHERLAGSARRWR